MIANRYRILELLGEGRGGRVLRVADTQRPGAAPLALRILAPGPDALAACHALARLRHPNCAAVVDIGQLADETPYYVMELVEGPRLDELGPLSGERFRAAFAPVLMAAAHVHALGLVLGDVRARDARVRADGTVKLIGYPDLRPAGGDRDARADLAALGAVARELLADPAAEPDLARVAARLAAEDPAERYASANQALADLGWDAPDEPDGALVAPPLFGRAGELARLFIPLSRVAERGPGGVVALLGAPGTGKSRMLREVLGAARLQGLVCGLAAGDESPGGLAPYSAIGGLLHALLPALEALPGFARHAPVLVALVPELGVPQAPPLEPATKEQLRLETAVAEVLIALAQQAPLALAVEDWPGVDPASQRLLTRLFKRAAGLPLLGLVTAADARAAELPEGAARLHLAPLEPSDARRTIAALLGGEVPEGAGAGAGDFEARVAGFAAGNPGRMEALLGLLIDVGALQHRGGRWAADMGRVEAVFPADEAGLWDARLRALPPAARAVAAALATAGPAVGEPLLRAAGLDFATLAAGLDALLARRLVARDATGRWAFPRAALAEAAYAQVDEAERARLHAAYAAALAAEPGPAPLARLLAIADHALGADDAAAAARAALLAGESCAALFAHAAAEHYLTRALSKGEAAGATRALSKGEAAGATRALSKGEAAGATRALSKGDAAGATRAPSKDDVEVRQRALSALGDMRRVRGDSAAAMVAYREAVPLAEARGDRVALGRIGTSLAKACQNLDDLPGALAACDAAAGDLAAAGDRAGLARCLLTRCRIRYFRGDAAEARADAAEALALARAIGDESRRGEGLAFVGYMHVATGDDLPEGVARLREAIDVLGAVGDALGLINAYVLLGNAEAMRGSLRGSRDAYGQALALCRETDDRHDACSALVNLAHAELELGDLAAARDLAEEGVRLALVTQSRYQVGLGLSIQALAAMNAGDHAGAAALLDEAAAIADQMGHAYMQGYMAQFGVELALAAGDPGAAIAASAAWSAFAADADPVMRATGAALLAEAEARAGRPGAGARLAEADAAAAPLGSATVRVRVARARAWERLAAGDAAGAEAAARGGLAEADAIGQAHAAAELAGLVAEARLLAGRAGAGGAGEAFDEMALRARARGYDGLRTIAQRGAAAAWSHALAPAGPAGSPAAGPAGGPVGGPAGGAADVEARRVRWLASPKPPFQPPAGEPVATFRTDARGRLTELSPAWEAITGLKPAACLGVGLAHFVHPGDRDALHAAAPTRIPALRLLHKTGAYRPVEAVLDPGPAGGPTGGAGLAGGLWDVAARAAAEAEGRLSAAVDAAALAATAALVIVLDPDGRVLRMNRACAEATGYVGEAARGRPVWDLLLLPEEAEAAAQAFAALGPDDFPRAMTQPMTTREGERRWIAWTETAVRDAEGRIAQIVRTGIDTTDARRATAQLASRERLLAEAQQLAHLGSWEWDLIADRVTWSDELFRIHGEHPGAFRPAPTDAWSRSHPADRDKVHEAIAHVRETGQPVRVEYRMLRPDGTERVLLLTAELMANEGGQPLRLVASVGDVTEQRKVHAMKDEFVAVVSHELRTPLTSIRGALGMLTTGSFGTLAPPGERMLTIAVQNVDRLAQLVNDILDLQRLGSPQSTLERQPCRLGDLLSHAADGVHVLAERAGVELATGPADITVDADPLRVGQVLANLLSNAIKFSGSGDVVRVSARVEDGMAVVRVRDEGRGIPPDKLEAVFERFAQVDASDSRQHGGTGLGLPICRAIVDQHGGRIWAESRLGVGSTFVFTLPLSDAPPRPLPD